jgi:hypothetical protein
LSWLQLGAQERVGTWRAYLDYADDLVEVCVPENARAACTDLARRSASEHPRVIVEGLRTLAGAFRYGTPCRPATRQPQVGAGAQTADVEPAAPSQ